MLFFVSGAVPLQLYLIQLSQKISGKSELFSSFPLNSFGRYRYRRSCPPTVSYPTFAETHRKSSKFYSNFYIFRDFFTVIANYVIFH